MLNIPSDQEKQMKPFVDPFYSLQEKGTWNGDVSGFRQQSMEKLIELGFPHKKTEEWKYTNVAPVLKQPYTLSSQTSELDLQPWLKEQPYGESTVRLVFVNGHLVPEYSWGFNDSQNGVVVTTLSHIDASNLACKDVVEAWREMGREWPEPFSSLNGGLFQDGYLIHVAAKSISNSPIQIVHIAHASGRENGVVMAHPRNLITLEQQSEATVVEQFIGPPESRYFVNTVTDAFVAPAGRLNYIKVQEEGQSAYHIGQLRAQLSRDSALNTFGYSTGAKLSRHNLNVKINDEGASACLNGLYLARDDQHVDNHTFIHHGAPHTYSNQLYKGVLSDKARGVFNGKIYVEQDAQKVDANLLNKNLLLSPKAEVDTKPELEVFADDVKATHGATVGQLSEEELFYYLSRGIPRPRAVQMMARGFVEDVLFQLPQETIKKHMDSLLDKSFTRFQEQIEGEG